MNQRNVDALIEILKEVRDYDQSNQELAELLTARGVLVLDVVTPEEWETIGSNFSPDKILERIAKGES